MLPNSPPALTVIELSESGIGKIIPLAVESGIGTLWYVYWYTICAPEGILV
jgi:hypothetical protein